MAVSPEFVAFVEELFAPLGGVRVRRMFGGGGIYSRDVMFGLVSDDTIYLKADAESARAFAARGSGPFVYEGGAKPITMSYWQLPADLIDDADEALVWGRKALNIARTLKAAAPKPRRAKAEARAAARKSRR